MAQLDFSGLGTKSRMVSRGPQRSWLAVAVSLSVFALLAAMVMVASNNRQPSELEVKRFRPAIVVSALVQECMWGGMPKKIVFNSVCTEFFDKNSCCFAVFQSNETVSLFKSALASQRSDLQKHRAAEAKAKEQVRFSLGLAS